VCGVLVWGEFLEKSGVFFFFLQPCRAGADWLMWHFVAFVLFEQCGKCNICRFGDLMRAKKIAEYA
jgi:hypothetical protein